MAILRGVTNWVQVTLPVLIGVILGIFVIIMVIMWLTDKGEGGGGTVEVADEPFDPMADGFPVPPLPGQTLPPSPRAGRAPVAATVSSSTGPGSGTTSEEDEK